MRSGSSYGKILLALTLLLGCPVNDCLSKDIRVQSDTLLRVFERDTASEEDAMVVPGYEYLQVDLGALTEPGLSFHLYGWGRVDFADNDYYDDQTAGELLYGYAEYQLATNRGTLRLGRQYLFDGVANAAMDGLRVSGDLGDYFTVSAYGGQPVGLDSTDGRSGDSMFGGRLANHLGSLYEVGLSYKKVDNDSDTAEEWIGVDIAAFLPAHMSLSGYPTYNQESEGWGEHSYELRIPLGTVLIKPSYQHFAYEDYFDRGANAVNPFRFLAGSDEKLSRYGVDVLWDVSAQLTVGGKVYGYDYDEQDDAEVYSLLAIWQGEGLTQVGGELGYTDADDTAGNSYTLVRVYGYCDALAERFGIDFVSGDLLLTFYDEEIYGEDQSVFVSFGGGKRFLADALTVKLSGDYSQDPYYDDDLRGMLTVTYNYDQE